MSRTRNTQKGHRAGRASSPEKAASRLAVKRAGNGLAGGAKNSPSTTTWLTSRRRSAACSAGPSSPRLSPCNGSNTSVT